MSRIRLALKKPIIGVIGTQLLFAAVLFAADNKPAAQGKQPTTVFLDVNVVPMDSEIVLPQETVVVKQGRITAIGPSTSTPVPPDAEVIDGHGRYLMPGLADMHVHLEGRSDFGDAPLFLAYGITTVLNLRGRPEILNWKKEIADGRLLAPNLYTSGEFVNEPRVRTPQEAEEEVVRQRADGYDVIKFHEIVVDGRYVTTQGLSRAAYDAMNNTARRIGIPLIGHAPDNLGLQAVLEDHQSLAHTGILVSLYFVPSPTVQRLLRPWLVSLGVVILLGVGVAVAALILRLRGRQISFVPELRTALAAASLFLLFVLLWPTFGLLSGSMLFLIALSIVALLIALVTIAAGVRAVCGWHSGNRSVWIRLFSIILAAASLAFALGVGVAVDIAWRSGGPNLRAFAAKCHQAGIWVEPTLIVYQNLNSMNDGRSAELLSDPVNRYLPPKMRERWAGIPAYRPSIRERAMAFLFRRNLLFTQRVTGSLERAGVPLMLGTDTFGFPFCIADKSAHDEMELMRGSGLTPYDVLQSATINPAKFLGKESEFGTATIGKRADLLLVDENPLVNLETTRKPDGVMLRGIWLPSEKLQQMLASLDETH